MAHFQLSKAIAEPPAKRHNNNRFNMYRPYHIRTLLATIFSFIPSVDHTCILFFTIYLAFDLFFFLLKRKKRLNTKGFKK